MSSFIDMYLDELVLTTPVHSNPKTSTTITVASSGDEGRNQNWAHPLRSYSCAEAVRDQATYEAVYNHWLVAGGPFLSWPFTDPMDFASVGLETPSIGVTDPDIPPPVISADDQQLGTGDGFNRVFQISKAYTRPLVGGGSGVYLRPILLPQLDSVVINMRFPTNPAFGGPYAPEDAPSEVGGPYAYTITRPGGQVTFTPAPINLSELDCGFYFDVPVRFDADDAFAGIVQNYRVAGFAALTWVETRNC